MTAPQRAEAMDYFLANPPSKILASNDPRLADQQELFAPAATTYAIFRWSKRLAMLCLGTSGLAFVVVGAAVLFAFRSLSAQYLALRIGWPVLRLTAVFQVLGQCTLAVLLSFWVTALWFEIYFIKLVGAFAILAAGGVFAILAAMRFKATPVFAIEGDILTENQAPSLWARIQSMAGKLGTSPPDRIIAGVDPSFFVTAHPVTLANTTQTGRTLYLSLPLLKTMSIDEADAVLGHEMAHFSGEDTTWSMRVAPLVARLETYMRELSQNPLTLSVFHFLHGFWKIYQISLRRHGRNREFRADSIGANMATPRAVSHALAKVSAYCQYRDEVEADMMKRGKLEGDIGLPAKLESGFPGSLAAFVNNKSSITSELPHPFDTHPPLAQRFKNLGLSTEDVLSDPALIQPPGRTWKDEIIGVDELEEKLWRDRETEIKQVHDVQKIGRLLPDGPDEIAILERLLPKWSYRGKGGKSATLEHDRLHISTWERPIMFADVLSLTLTDGFIHKKARIGYRDKANGKSLAVIFVPAEFSHPDGRSFIEDLGLYLGRYQNAAAHRTAVEYVKQREAESSGN